MEAASDTEGSELSFQVDPRKTVSEPPLSPRSIIGATPEDARPSLPAEGTGEPEGTPNAGTSLPAGGTGEPEGIPNAVAQKNLKVFPMLEPACLQEAQKNQLLHPLHMELQQHLR